MEKFHGFQLSSMLFQANEYEIFAKLRLTTTVHLGLFFYGLLSNSNDSLLVIII